MRACQLHRKMTSSKFKSSRSNPNERAVIVNRFRAARSISTPRGLGKCYSVPIEWVPPRDCGTLVSRSCADL